MHASWCKLTHWWRPCSTDCGSADCTGPTANRLWDVGPDYGWIKLNKTELCLDAGDCELNLPLTFRVTLTRAVVGASQTNGRKLTLQTCSFFSSGHRANAQIWWYPLNRSNPWHRLELAGGSCSPQRTNKCMDLTDGNVNGGAVQLWECALGNMNQAFDLGPWCVHC